jgi:hypothetical protein
MVLFRYLLVSLRWLFHITPIAVVTAALVKVILVAELHQHLVTGPQDFHR